MPRHSPVQGVSRAGSTPINRTNGNRFPPRPAAGKARRRGEVQDRYQESPRLAISRSVPVGTRPAAARALALARNDGRTEVLEWAAKALRTAVDGAPPNDEDRVARLCDLAEVLLDRFGRAHDRVDVQEAVTRLQEA